jgi:hypothetical protein
MDNKSIDKCNLAEDAKSNIAYYNINRNKKRDWRWCPRCNAKAVNKPLRKCLACGGRLIFDGDTGMEYNRRMDYWFIYHTDLYGITGWFSKDYWDGKFA